MLIPLAVAVWFVENPSKAGVSIALVVSDS